MAEHFGTIQNKNVIKAKYKIKKKTKRKTECHQQQKVKSTWILLYVCARVFEWKQFKRSSSALHSLFYVAPSIAFILAVSNSVHFYVFFLLPFSMRWRDCKSTSISKIPVWNYFFSTCCSILLSSELAVHCDEINSWCSGNNVRLSYKCCVLLHVHSHVSTPGEWAMFVFFWMASQCQHMG